jgi:hypothetical protein
MLMKKNDTGLLSRRGFLQLGATTAIATHALAMAPAAPASQKTMADVPFRKREPRLGLIGTGGRGTSLLKNLLGADAQVVGLCDIVAEKATAAQALVTKAGQKSPDLYTEGPHAYQKMLQRDDIDFVVVATPWSWHAEMALYAMEHGKDVAIEVPGVTTIADCWRIVDTSERTRRHCMMLENCCYGYNETLVLRMIHAGLFGDLLYGEGAYLHDLREELFSHGTHAAKRQPLSLPWIGSSSQLHGDSTWRRVCSHGLHELTAARARCVSQETLEARRPSSIGEVRHWRHEYIAD